MARTADNALFRKLPSVDELLRTPELAEIVAQLPQLATDAAREAIARLRREIASGTLTEAEVDLTARALPIDVRRTVERVQQFSLRPVINATGVILHTNLGRAPLSVAAIEHLREVATRFSNLEFDIATGERGKRDIHVDSLFRRLLADAAPDLSTIVVNNNAAAVLLAINELGEGGEVIVSRGELVEIGGSFRIPDVMSKSGATLREVGTTNRTRISDYENAINERTRLLLRVHRSNFEIVGFTEQPALEELVDLGRKRGIPVMEDLGSGALFDLREVGVFGESGVRESLKAGVDVVTYSGDKLLGGPQAGLLSGRADLIGRIRRNPLFRALRVDKLTYSVLESTLLAYLTEDYNAIPAVRMMRLPVEAIATRAEAMAESVGAEVVDGESVLGGGAAPGASLPTKLVVITPTNSASETLRRLRENDPPVIARVVEDRVVLDLRTVFPDDDAQIIAALKKL